MYKAAKSLTDPLIFVLKGTGKAIRSDFFQGISAASQQDWMTFLKQDYSDVRDMDFSQFIQHQFDPKYKEAVLVIPGGNSVLMADACGSAPLSLVAKAIRTALHSPSHHYRIIGSCAGAALSSRTIESPRSTAWIPGLGLLPTITAIGPLLKTPALHTLRLANGVQTSSQFGWENIGFADSGEGDIGFIAQYADYGHAAALQTKQVLAFGFHPEATIPDSKLLAVAQSQFPSTVFWQGGERAASEKAAREMVKAFINN